MSREPKIHHAEIERDETTGAAKSSNVTCEIGCRAIPLHVSEDWNEVTCRLCLRDRPFIAGVPKLSVVPA